MSRPLSGLRAGSVSRHVLGVLLVAVSAAGFGFIPLFALAAYGGGANLVTLLLVRFTLGAAGLWLYVLVGRRPWRVDRRDLFWLIGMGVAGYAVQSSLYYTSVRFIPASLAALLLYAYPMLVSLLAWWLHKEPVRGRTALALLAALVGVVLVLGASASGYNPLGTLLALGAAAVYSGYIVAGAPVSRRVDAIVMSTYIASAAAVTFGVAALVGGGLTLHLTAGAWGALLGNTVVATLIAIPAFFAGVALIGPAGAAIVSTLEPLVTIVASGLLLGERLSLTQGVGAALVLGSSVLIATAQRPDPGDRLPGSTHDVVP